MSGLDTNNSLLAGIYRCRKSPSYVNCGCKIQRLQYVQDNAVRVVQKEWKYDHVTPILSHLYWLPISYRIQLKVLTIVLKYIHLMASRYLSDLIVLYEPGKPLRSDTKGPLLRLPRTNLVTAGDQMFSKVGPLLWNILQRDIRECSSLNILKSLLTTYLFTSWHMDRKDLLHVCVKRIFINVLFYFVCCMLFM